MEGMALIQFSHSLPGAELKAIGDLHLHQKTALNRRFAPGENFEDIAGNTRTTFEISNIFERYAGRNGNPENKNLMY